MRKIKYYWLLGLAGLLAGCTTSKDALLPAGEQTVLVMWQGNQAGHATASARETLRRSLTSSERLRALEEPYHYSRSAAQEISRQFPRLPNPDMVMYVYPHLVTGNTPIPGYSTVFPFYQQVQYALPGERTEAL
ncbi:TIGR03751 family conjugal transfer lipoprotein [Xenorhabdus bovienii]|uniref:TIGR03751 family conjugal transfer lipoprotein n=1 Tax=Xenorhabdus bovienii TaxID=40576 RepID=UPI00237D1CE2|nr:TIGR03751 family conjugal transfer lipoprotein [Xenorhabdus bovienii]MDE1486553.1 TIGR03751 family conjugal transfer lipoprotein [Xenorhabdus bovienii]MDE1496045.1 TIGR03751 family conjugal transfer lipoprotein [Xenorhabdus bovienii]MDE9446609.1 TIGR03751 family conjugal transfer lipoprotein [Xenorhabdus bovienii]MDE9474073.1 TIGR03751 family conjugal transfer lipoprotein [Xenorhabdus bovienii]MDE9477173.1 TIGR03751 family conjugal transfer lipoprotein [Xenorhabdus bovienii]